MSALTTSKSSNPPLTKDSRPKVNSVRTRIFPPENRGAALTARSDMRARPAQMLEDFR